MARRVYLLFICAFSAVGVMITGAPGVKILNVASVSVFSVNVCGIWTSDTLKAFWGSQVSLALPIFVEIERKIKVK